MLAAIHSDTTNGQKALYFLILLRQFTHYRLFVIAVRFILFIQFAKHFEREKSESCSNSRFVTANILLLRYVLKCRDINKILAIRGELNIEFNESFVCGDKGAESTMLFVFTIRNGKENA